MPRTTIAERFGVDHPILQAPKARVTTTPELVAALVKRLVGEMGAE